MLAAEKTRNRLADSFGLLYVSLYIAMSEKKKFGVNEMMSILADDETTLAEADAAVDTLHKLFFENGEKG